MNAKKLFSLLLSDRKESYDTLAPRLNMNSQSLRNKVSRNNYGLNDFIDMMELFNCDVIVKKRDTNETFIVNKE